VDVHNSFYARQRVEEMKKVPAQYMLGGGWLALNLAGP